MAKSWPRIWLSNIRGKWLSIGNRSLQAFLAAAPTMAKDPMGRRGLRRVSPAYRVAA